MSSCPSISHLEHLGLLLQLLLGCPYCWQAHILNGFGTKGETLTSRLPTLISDRMTVMESYNNCTCHYLVTLVALVYEMFNDILLRDGSQFIASDDTLNDI